MAKVRDWIKPLPENFEPGLYFGYHSSFNGKSRNHVSTYRIHDDRTVDFFGPGGGAYGVYKVKYLESVMGTYWSKMSLPTPGSWKEKPGKDGLYWISNYQTQKLSLCTLSDNYWMSLEHLSGGGIHNLCLPFHGKQYKWQAVVVPKVPKKTKK